MIYKNENYEVRQEENRTCYEVVNNRNGMVEYSHPALLEALRTAYIFDVGLRSFFDQISKKEVPPTEDLEMILTNKRSMN